MVAKLRGSRARSWSTLGSGLAHTASHSAVWIDFALEVAGESATATTSSIRSLRIVTPRPRATSRRLDSEFLLIAHRDARARSRRGFQRATLSAGAQAPRNTGSSEVLTFRSAARLGSAGGVLVEEPPQRLIGSRLGLGVLEQGVHLPPHPVGVADPELVGLRVAARGPLLLQEVDGFVLHAHHLRGHVPGAGVADAEVAHRARLPADVERQDHGRVGDLELRVVVPDLGRLLAENLPIAGNRRLQVFDVQRYVERIVGHGSSSSIDRCRYPCTWHRPMSISTHVDKGGGGGLLCPAAADPSRPGRRRGPRDRVQGDRRSGAAPAAQLHCRPARGRGMRLPSGPAARAGAADREPSLEGADRGRTLGARAPGHLDVLSPRARARGGSPTGAGAPVRETGGEEVRMTLGRRLTADLASERGAGAPARRRRSWPSSRVRSVPPSRSPPGLRLPAPEAARGFP